MKKIFLLCIVLLFSASVFSKDQYKYGFGFDFSIHDESNLDKYRIASFSYWKGTALHYTYTPSFFLILNERSTIGINVGLGESNAKLYSTTQDIDVDYKQRSFIAGVYFRSDILRIDRTVFFLKPQFKFRIFDKKLEFYMDELDMPIYAFTGDKYHSIDLNLGLGIEYRIFQKLLINLTISNDILAYEKETPKVSSRFETSRWVSFREFFYYSFGIKVLI